MENLFWKTVYNLFIFPVFRIVLVLLFFKDEKIKEGFISRSGILGRFMGFARTLSPRDRLIWFHATSVGEFEQARPLIEKFKEKFSDIKILLTFFSPSGFRYGGTYPFADYIDYLPLDSRKISMKILSALRPKAFIYVKFDIWPNWVWSCQKLGIPVLIANATLTDRSRRLKSTLMRSFYKSIYRGFSYIGAVSDSDAANFLRTDSRLGARVSVVGDTRFDQVDRRKRNRKNKKLFVERRSEKDFILLLGSVWPQDNAVIMPAVAELSRRFSDQLRVIIVPHEPDAAHVCEVLGHEYVNAAKPVYYSKIEKTENVISVPRCLIVDRVGILPELYALADAAYVGGSFSTGVHNVIEPAIMALPVICGKVMHNAPEAEEMAKKGLLRVISKSNEFEQYMRHLIEDTEFRKKVGGGLQEFVRSRLGTTETYFEEITARISI